MSDGYTVHHHQHGRYIIGWVPVRDLVALMKRWGEEGFDVCDGRTVGNRLTINPYVIGGQRAAADQ